MRSLLALALLACAVTAHAHPGVGIVRNSRGDVFYTDLRHVWRIAPDGKLSIVVRDVHTHELYLDAKGDLFGEHLWYDGRAWRHRVWRRSAAGRVSEVMGAREGFLRDMSFARDWQDSHYWVDGTVIGKRSRDGRVTQHAAGLRKPGRMTVTRGGTVYVMDGGDLRKVSPEGEVTLLRERLSGQQPPHANVADANHHMGLWTDEAGDVYVAVAGERLVMRVNDHGANVVARSPAPWAPSGGTIGRDGDLWLLEYDDANRVRVRQVSEDGRSRVFGEGVR